MLKKEITKEIGKYYEMNERKNRTHKNLCATTNTVFRGKFVTGTSLL